MSELRIKLLELSIQGGATIENATKVAADWERWATEDDPLRLDVPSPSPSLEERKALLSPQLEALIRPVRDRMMYIENSGGIRLEIGRTVDTARYFDDILMQLPIDLLSDTTWREFDPKNPGKKEIDWSRPQLVRAKDVDCIVETTGVHDDPHVGRFTGYEIFNGKKSDIAGDYWEKSKFVYHGEIEEPKNPGKSTPPPVIEEDFHDQLARLEVYKKELVSTPTPMEIDWDRPQLVRSKYNSCVVKTNGSHGDTWFDGVAVVAGDNGANPVGDNTGAWAKECFVYHGEIEEPRTTGLNFLEALNAICENKGLGMRRTPSSAVFVAREGRLLPLDINRVGDYVEIFLDHLLATDWQIIEA